MPSTDEIIEVVDTASDVIDHALVAVEAVGKVGVVASILGKRKLLIVALMAAAVVGAWKFVGSKKSKNPSAVDRSTNGSAPDPAAADTAAAMT
ncbi:MAG: hypothetical protein HKN24_06750 [Acidimicrobiales bacterium]|nr:hypothetical protein [Acidimicrobiales bacterium]